MKLLLCALLVVCVCMPGDCASWGSKRSDKGKYEVETPSGEIENNSRCAKVHNVHGPLGYRQRWRPLNTAEPSAFWSVPTGPRSSFASRPEDVPSSLWQFLGGERHLFVNFVGFDGTRRSVYAAQRCVAFTNISVTDNRTTQESHVGVTVAVQDDQTLLVASPRMRDDLNFLGQPFYPVVLGMTPGDPGALVSTSSPWAQRMFEDAPEYWYTERFRPETRLVGDLEMWGRDVAPQYEVVDGADTKVDDWFALLPTRLYNETQCKSYLTFEEDVRERRVQELPQIGVSDVITGGNVCDVENNTWDTLELIATVRRGSPNKVQPPLTTAEGILLVSVPGIWEFTTATLLLSVRIGSGKTRRVSRKQKFGWILIELCTIAVAAGECALLSLSAINQLEWQPCWIGRWAGGRQNFVDRGTIELLGNNKTVLEVRSDVVAVECVEDPGTDAKWAVVIGVVVAFHLVLLFLECVYFALPSVQTAVDKSFSSSYNAVMQRRSTRTGNQNPVVNSDTDGFDANDDNEVVDAQPPRSERLIVGSFPF